MISQNKPDLGYKKIDFVMILWYQKLVMIFWYHKINVLISQNWNRICDIKNSQNRGFIVKRRLILSIVNAVLLQMPLVQLFSHGDNFSKSLVSAKPCNIFYKSHTRQKYLNYLVIEKNFHYCGVWRRIHALIFWKCFAKKNVASIFTLTIVISFVLFWKCWKFQR